MLMRARRDMSSLENIPRRSWVLDGSNQYCVFHPGSYWCIVMSYPCIPCCPEYAHYRVLCQCEYTNSDVDWRTIAMPKWSSGGSALWHKQENLALVPEQKRTCHVVQTEPLGFFHFYLHRKPGIKPAM